MSATRSDGTGVVTTGLLLGLDVGTTNVKVMAADLHANRWWVHCAPTPWQSDRELGGWMDPADLLATITRLLTTAVDHHGDRPVRALGVTGMAESGVVTTRDGRVVTPVLAWQGQRGAQDASLLGRELPDFSVTTGLPVGPKPSLVSWHWWERVRGSRPRDATWASVPEWVVYALGGQRVSEVSLAARTGWFNLDERDWWDEALAWAGTNRNQLAPLARAGQPMGHAARPRACVGAVLTVAGHDHPCAAVGADATSPDVVVHSCGTAEVLVRTLTGLPSRERRCDVVNAGFAVGPHVVEGNHLVIGGQPSGGRLSRVLERLSLPGPSDADDLARAFTTSDPGHDVDLVGFADVRGLDQWLDRAVVVDGAAARAEVWAAALDVTARTSKNRLLQFLDLTGAADEVVRLGGWGRDGLLAERIAALDHLPVVTGPPEAAAVGAIAFAADAAGLTRPTLRSPEDI